MQGHAQVEFLYGFLVATTPSAALRPWQGKGCLPNEEPQRLQSSTFRYPAQYRSLSRELLTASSCGGNLPTQGRGSRTLRYLPTLAQPLKSRAIGFLRATSRSAKGSPSQNEQVGCKISDPQNEELGIIFQSMKTIYTVGVVETTCTFGSQLKRLESAKLGGAAGDTASSRGLQNL